MQRAASFLCRSSKRPTPLACRCFSAEQQETVVHLPFRVNRTKIGNLPVYVHKYHQDSLVVTHVRNYIGNVEELTKGVQAVVGPSVLVRTRPGRIEVKGDHQELIEAWLRSIGT